MNEPTSTPPKPALSSNPAESDRQALEASAWLAAVVKNSDDAIISKTLDGIITTWNSGAERLFGYAASEAIGKPITMLIPDDRLFEEDDILRRLRAGESIEHFETVRRRKDGDLIDISVTVSPVKDDTGRILGASKIARDIGARKRAIAEQALLLKEMNHRIKNLFSLTAGLVGLSARATAGGEALAADLSSRLRALARAHELTMPDLNTEQLSGRDTTLIALLTAIVAPHEHAIYSRIGIRGEDVPLGGKSLTSVALLLHELATNAAKYGALSVPGGRLSISIATDDKRLRLEWDECNAPSSPPEHRREGFGSTLERAALSGIRGEITRMWKNDGVLISLEAPLESLAN